MTRLQAKFCIRRTRRLSNGGRTAQQPTSRGCRIRARRYGRAQCLCVPDCAGAYGRAGAFRGEGDLRFHGLVREGASAAGEPAGNGNGNCAGARKRYPKQIPPAAVGGERAARDQRFPHAGRTDFEQLWLGGSAERSGAYPDRAGDGVACAAWFADTAAGGYGAAVAGECSKASGDTVRYETEATKEGMIMFGGSRDGRNFDCTNLEEPIGS